MAEAFSRLLQYLTVQVSEMFRDPSYFRAIREHVVPVLQTYPSINVWVAGCSTAPSANDKDHGQGDKQLNQPSQPYGSGQKSDEGGEGGEG